MTVQLFRLPPPSSPPLWWRSYRSCPTPRSTPSPLSMDTLAPPNHSASTHIAAGSRPAAVRRASGVTWPLLPWQPEAVPSGILSQLHPRIPWGLFWAVGRRRIRWSHVTAEQTQNLTYLWWTVRYPRDEECVMPRWFPPPTPQTPSITMETTKMTHLVVHSYLNCLDVSLTVNDFRLTSVTFCVRVLLSNKPPSFVTLLYHSSVLCLVFTIIPIILIKREMKEMHKHVINTGLNIFLKDPLNVQCWCFS